MEYDVAEIFERILITCKIKNLKDLSIHFGYKENWASSTRSRKTIPWDICLKIAIEYNLSIDYLVFGVASNVKRIDIEELKTPINEGVFNAIQAELIELNEGVKISNLVKTITSEISEHYDIQEINKIKKVV
jgi:hypothetical protein